MTRPTATRKAVGYCRVSTEGQADRGVSLDAQAEKIRATVQDAELIDVIVDGGESGKSLQRPGIERLLAMVDRREVQVVIIAKLDRLTRNVRDLGELLERFQRRGVALVSVGESLDTGSAAGRLVLNVMASVSQWEREAIGERTRDALQHKRAQGLRAGNVPFGYSLAEDGQTLLPNADEANTFATIRRLRQARYSLRQVASELNARGLRTRSGSRWRHEYVANLLKTASTVIVTARSYHNRPRAVVSCTSSGDRHDESPLGTRRGGRGDVTQRRPLRSQRVINGDVTPARRDCSREFGVLPNAAHPLAPRPEFDGQGRADHVVQNDPVLAGFESPSVPPRVEHDQRETGQRRHRGPSVGHPDSQDQTIVIVR